MSDTLVGRAFGWFNRGLSWTEIVRKRKPDMVIISAGPHVTAAVGTPGMREIVDQVSAEHLEHFPDLPLIWRSQPPAGCAERTHHETLEVEPFMSRSKNDTMYNYRFFLEWDDLAREIFDRPDLNRRFLDISPLYARMPDKAAGDCMHFCTGALASFVGDVLLHAISDVWPER
ncbi:hypothetical protein HDU93_008955 [Gonapodya sp. JEL0774]|nr:hypothetical protein HDU93_008955 [Gonapodya sp. JEL0774]